MMVFLQWLIVVFVFILAGIAVHGCWKECQQAGKYDGRCGGFVQLIVVCGLWFVVCGLWFVVCG